jgi:hypothetical protein
LSLNIKPIGVFDPNKKELWCEKNTVFCFSRNTAVCPMPVNYLQLCEENFKSKSSESESEKRNDDDENESRK